jgi:endo-1,4-beta-xylanase
MAAAADPTAKLYYNDYNLEYGDAKHKGALRIAKLVQSWGVKIDGVGLQAHLTSESTKTQSVVTPSVAVLTRTLQDYADLGLDVAYTELDIRSNTPSNDGKLATAAAAWGRVAQSCINVSRCVGITIWVSFSDLVTSKSMILIFEQGVADKYSWVPGTFSGEGSALLWTDNLQKKPAYTAVLDVLNGKNVTRV